MRPADAPAVVVLRRPLTPAQLAVLAELAEAPAYKVIARRLGITTRTVRLHVAHIAGVLPLEWFPRASTKDRAVFYAQRQHAAVASLATRTAAA